MSEGFKSSELSGAVGGTGVMGVVAILGDKLPADQTWIALVVFGFAACCYISWRSYLKLRSMNIEAAQRQIVIESSHPIVAPTAEAPE